MSETPKSESTNFEFIDRRKLKAQEEQETAQSSERETVPEPPPESPKEQPRSGPHLVEESRKKPVEAGAEKPASAAEAAPEAEMPPPPTAQEAKEQKTAYDASAQRIEEMARAQNPGMGAQPPVSFEQLIQQFYLSGLIQMGVGTQQGERPQIDILGARSTIDLLGVLAEKTRGNLTPSEDRMMQSILYELRMMFLEITGMISMPHVPPPAKK